MRAIDVGLKVIRSFSGYEQCLCPFHDDRHPSAIFYHNTYTLHCFVCAKTFTLREIANANKIALSDEEIESLSYETLERNIESFMKSYEYLQKAQTASWSIGTAKSQIDSDSWDYFLSRGIDESVADDYRVKLTNGGVVFFHRQNIQTISGYVVRVAKPINSTMRYIKVGELENFWPTQKILSLTKPIERVIITEGPFKAMRIEMALRKMGIHDTVSVTTFGTRFSHEMTKTIEELGTKTIIIGDGDEAGRNWAKKFKGKRCCFPFAANIEIDNVEIDDVSKMLESTFSIVDSSTRMKNFE